MEDASPESWLDRWADRQPGSWRIAETPRSVGGGFDTRIWAFAVDSPEGRSELVLRVFPSRQRLDGARQEARTIAALDRAGFSVPSIVDPGDADGPDGLPYLVMTFVPGDPAAVVMTLDPPAAATIVDPIARAQADLHRLPLSLFGGPSDTAEVDRRLATLDEPGLTAEMRAGRDWLLATAGAARRADDAFCHYDLHPLNVIVDGARQATVIDWIGAGVGDHHSDLARSVVLFTWAGALAPAEVRPAVLQWATPASADRWVRAYERHGAVDRAALDWWIAFHELDGWIDTSLRCDPDDPRRAARDALGQRFLEHHRRRI